MTLLLTGCASHNDIPFPGNDAWGPLQEDLRTRLIPGKESYKLGDSILVTLEMKNLGEVTRKYDSQTVAVNRSLIVKGPDGKEVPYVGGSTQTGMGYSTLRHGETVILFDSLDIASQYLVSEPGTYTVQFRGQKYGGEIASIPPSNILEIKVKPGNMKPVDQVITRLQPILPKKWILIKSTKSRVRPAGRKESDGFQMALLSYEGLKPNYVLIHIWITEGEAAPMVKERLDMIQLSEYAGITEWGHLYLYIPDQVMELWENARAEITVALGTKE
jgi:hypothetical protein